jgi:Zn-dependent M28 family amino/carboxypeptidase
MKTKLLLGITIMALAACGSENGAEPDERSASEAAEVPSSEPAGSPLEIDEAVLREHIATLSDDSFEGRAPGTPGGMKTRSYLAEEMAEAGLEPLGDSYEHMVTLVSRTLDPKTSSASFTLPSGERPLEYGPEAVFWTKRDDETLSIDASEVVFVGHGVVAPEYGWNDYEGIDARGKTVVMLINDPGFRQQGEDFGGLAMTYYGRWTYKYEEAARQGAEAAIIIHQTEPAAYGWGVVEGSWSGPQLNLPRNPDETQPVTLEGWVTLEVAEAMFEAAGLDFAELEEAATQTGFEPVPLEGVTFSAELAQTLEETESANVAGVLRGTETPDEYILYTAHWDHLGMDQALIDAGEDGIYNGAVDNATGTAALLAIAEAWGESGVSPKRSHLFVAVTAEESGLLGSKAFASSPPVPLASIVGGLNIDAVLPAGESNDLTVIGFGASELEDVLSKVAGVDGVTLSPDPSPQNGYFYRSDHIEFAKRGVPMLYVDGGTDLKEGGIQAGEQLASAYTTGPYHNPSDEYSEDWDLSGMVQLLEILAGVGFELDQSGDDPNWYEGNEFRSIRDEQLAEAGR